MWRGSLPQRGAREIVCCESSEPHEPGAVSDCAMQQDVAKPPGFTCDQGYWENVQVTESLRIRFRLIGPADKLTSAQTNSVR